MQNITRMTVQLSLIITPPSDAARDDFEVQMRELVCEVGRAGSELMMGAAEQLDGGRSAPKSNR
jgi:hypothetical protein